MVFLWCLGGVPVVLWWYRKNCIFWANFAHRCLYIQMHAEKITRTRFYTQKLPTQIGHKTSHFDFSFGRWARVSSGNGSSGTSSAETNYNFTSTFRDQHAFRAGTVHSAPAELQFHPSLFTINTCFVREKFIAHRLNRILTTVFADRCVCRAGRARPLNCNLIYISVFDDLHAFRARGMRFARIDLHCGAAYRNGTF